MGGGFDLGAAALAGLLSFLSPCVLPVVPAYLTFLTGLGLDQDAPRGRVVAHALAFVLGFSAVFVLLGLSASAVGRLLQALELDLARLGGALLILFALLLLGVGPRAWQREWRLHLQRKPAGVLGSALVGVTFAAGWTPCIGPVLGGILTLAATSERVGHGAVLLTSYALGLAVPFLAVGFAWGRAIEALRRLRPWLPWLHRASAALLLGLGGLLLSGGMTSLSAWLARWTPRFLWERL